MRQLLRLREAPQLPVLWLVVPWLAASVWSWHIARLILLAELQLRPLDAFMVAVVTGQYIVVGGLGVVLSWAWLYLAWPEHPRVLCWCALAGVIALWAGPRSLAPVAPSFVSLSMVGAVIEQVVASRRSRARAASATPAA